MRRRLLIAAALLGALALAVVLGARSESALRFAVAHATRLTGGRVAIEGVSGSLLGPLRAERVVIQSQGGTRTVALVSELAPRWRGLVRGALAFDAVTVSELRIEPGPERDEPPVVPATIALPFALTIERVEIAKVVIGGRTELTAIRGSLALGGGEHRATLTRLTSPWGELSGSARVETAPPFALRGEIAYARAELPSTRARATASGSLVDAALALAGTLGDAPVTGELRFCSFARPWLKAITLRGEHVDTAAFVRSANAPHSDLAVIVEARGDPDALAAGTLRAENAKPAPLSERALPLRALSAELRLADGALHFPKIDADLGAAGEASGSGRIADAALQLDLDVERLDLHALHASLRPTQLAGDIDAEISAARIESSLALRERGRELRGRIVREGEAVRAEDVRVAIGRGEITGSGEWDGASRFELKAQLAAFDPAALGDFPAASLSGEIDAAGELGEAWNARVTYALNGSRFRGQALGGRGALTIAASRISQADAELRLGANRLHARGAFGASGDALSLTIAAPELGALGDDFAGSLALDARLGGTFARPGGELSVHAHELVLPGGVSIAALEANARLGTGRTGELTAQLRGDGMSVAGVRVEDASLTAAGTLAAHDIALEAHGAVLEEHGAALALAAQLSGGWDGQWSGRLTALETSGRLAARLEEPTWLRYAPPARVELGPARVAALGGELTLGSFLLADRRLETAGVAMDLSLADALRALGRDPAVAGDLRVRGVWVVPRDPAQLGQVRLELASGDAQLAGAPLGLRTFTIDAALGASVAHVTANVTGQRLGRADLRADLSAAKGRALLARTSLLDAQLDAEVESIRALGGLLGISARVEGRGSFALAASGTVGKPQLRGSVNADGLRFDWPSAGIALREGTLRARLAPDVLHVDALTFAAAKGELSASGDVPLDGKAALLNWQAKGLRVLDRPDRNLEVSGKGEAGLSEGRLALRGELRARRGYIEVPRVTQSKLGDDVIVLAPGRDPERAASSARTTARLDLDLELDAGKKLRVVGSGLDTVLRGRVRVKTLPDGELVAFGEIDATKGTYRAFGQKLEIERGALIFNGAIDDPALDVLALRKNLPVEAGVILTGTLKQPLLELTSSPPVPDSEKLSWLMLGHGASDASAADTALLQAATATLFSGDGAVPLQQRIAHGVGLDEIALRNTGELASTEASGRAVALGKRLGDKLYLEYEYGLEAASHLVRLHYELTRALSVRAETSGEISNLGVNYRKSW